MSIYSWSSMDMDSWSSMDIEAEAEMREFLFLERDRETQTPPVATAIVPVGNQALDDSHPVTDNASARAEEELTFSEGKRHGAKRKRKLSVSVPAKKAKTVQCQSLGDSLSFGEEKYLPWEVIAYCIFPRLSLRDSCSFLFSQKAFLLLLKAPRILNQLFSNPKIQHVKLSRLVDPLLGSIHTLDLSKSSESDHQLTQLIQKCSNLTSLALERSKPPADKLMDAVARQSSKLKSLTLIDSSKNNSWLNDSPPFKLLLQKSWDLTSLNLKGCRTINDAAIRTLLGNKQQLISLNLDYSQQISGELIEEVAQDCINLTALHLNRLVTETTIETLAQNCTNLKSLRLDLSPDRSCQLLAQRFPNLKELDCNSSNVPGGFITNLLESHADLVSLNLCLGWSLETAIVEVRPNYESLTRLTLIEPYNLAESDLCRLLRACKSLAHFGLKSNILVTKAVIETLWENCKNLSELDLGNCLEIQDVDLFEKLEQRSSLTKLSLSRFMRGTNPIQDEAIESLIKKCPNLTKVNLSGCDYLTDLIIKTLAESCKNLKSLDISNRREITGKSIQTLAMHSKNLQKIRLQNCKDKSINEACIEDLIKTSTQRVKIYLCQTGTVTGNCAKSLTAKYPDQVYVKKNG